MREETTDAKRDLEDLLGKEVTEASCPFGSYDRRVLRCLRSAGYERVYTSDRGYADAQCWLLPRNTIHGSDSLATLEAMIDTGWPILKRLAMGTRRCLKRWR